MFQTVGDVMRALKAFREHYDPRSRSVMLIASTTTDVDAEPFRRGFLESLTLRTELLRRLSALDERERAVLMLWFVSDLGVRTICARLRLSRSNCYRIRDRALLAMLDQVGDVQEAFA